VNGVQLAPDSLGGKSWAGRPVRGLGRDENCCGNASDTSGDVFETF
jgi:hypothetical protein